ncbi:MAG: hypothetical protein WCG27_01255 [Pseudomonadota bacterium]
MEMNSIQKAVQDLTLIRQAIENTRSGEGKVSSDKITLSAHVLIQGAMCLIAASLALFEIFSTTNMTSIAMISAHDWEIGLWGLVQVAVALPVLLLAAYFIVWRASKHVDEEFSSYVARNFRYLKNLSLFSDLLTKFIPLSFLVMAGVPQYVAPLLTLYIGDYLINGRLFTYPVKASLVLGVACIAGAAFQCVAHNGLLLIPLVIFTFISAGSTACMVWKKAL